MSDLIERLRFGMPQKMPRPGQVFGDDDIAAFEQTAEKAADELERLTKVNAELLDALVRIRDATHAHAVVLRGIADDALALAAEEA